jgi:ATP-dependent Clp protease ATP-binding subunit ClpA
VIQQRLENSIASRILDGKFADGQTIKIDVDSAKHDFRIGV